jgi:uncharacterized protein (TIGR03118 family)
MSCTRIRHVAVRFFAASMIVISPECLRANTLYLQVNLVSDVPGLAAVTDPNFKNPWGVAFSGGSPFWFSNQGSGTATLHDGTGTATALIVTIPPLVAGTPPGLPSSGVGPTGQVFNSAGAGNFVLSDGSAATFLFDTLDGQILGWNGGAGTTALHAATTTGAAYSGLTLASVGVANYLYATDEHGHINIFDNTFQDVTGTTFGGKFVDPNPVSGFNPFNIQNIGGNLFVTYAALNANGFGMPGGYVDKFDSSGNFLARVATNGSLAAPWGVALAPAGFGSFAGDLLIGNFGNGQILAFDPNNSNAFLGVLDNPNGQPITIPDLWALEFRTAGTGVSPNDLYFTAGINGQRDGLFGDLQQAPEPGTLLVVGAGLIASAVLRLRSRT